MCGIVGILGQKAVAGDIVDALRRLEYRGYDSAGVATVENGHLDRRRAEASSRTWSSGSPTIPCRGAPASATRAGQRTASRSSATPTRT
jgi:glucosamine--fructose-6-phosphate aminotransferase (isomerizing)